MTISISLLYSSEITREGLKGIIEKSCNSNSMKVECFSTFKDLLEHEKTNKPDIFIIDFSLSELEKLAFIEKLLKIDPNNKIIAYIEKKDPDLIYEIYGTGAKGIIYKYDNQERILEAITTVYNYNYYITPLISNEIIERLITYPDNSTLENYKIKTKLTSREKQIIQYVCNELSDKEIADKLTISINTVRVHKKNIMRKLNLHSTVGMLLYAIRHKLIYI